MLTAVDETIARFDDAIARHCAAHEQEAVIQLLDTIPGVGRAMAELLVAEVGVDMSVSREYPPTSDGLSAGVL